MKWFILPTTLMIYFCSFTPAYPCSLHSVAAKTKTEFCTGFERPQMLSFGYNICAHDLSAIIEPSNLDYKIRTIVLDAGHGGKDRGCTGANGTFEKNLTLEYSLMLGNMIKKAYPDIRIIYTRDKDEFIELHERANISNKNKADLFISIHCNWNPNPKAYGTETYVLGLHRAKDNLEVAKRENSSIFLESNYQKNYDGFDPNSPEGNILLCMSQNAHIDQSISLSDKIEDEFKNKRHSRGVRQAGFLVLRCTSTPAILIETGFLSNENEEAFMTSDAGKKYIVNSIFKGFERYKASVEFSINEIAKSEKNNENDPEPEPLNITPAVNPEAIASGKSQSKAITLPADDMEVAETQDNKSTQSKLTAEAAPIETESRYLEYCVQLTTSGKLLDITGKLWANFSNIIARNENNLYKYQAVCNTLAEAQVVKAKARALGFEDAFVCAYYQSKKISLEEAKALESTVSSR